MCAMQANNLTITRNFRNAALLSEFYDKKTVDALAYIRAVLQSAGHPRC